MSPSFGGQVFAPVFALLLQPAGHATITEPATDDLLAIAPVNESSGQIEFVYEDPGLVTSSPTASVVVLTLCSADSLEFVEPIRLYPCNLCHVKCRRPYDLERHHKTKHHQSEHWFCPVDTCKLSCTVTGLGSNFLGYGWMEYKRKPLTIKHLLSDEENGYHKVQLHGFPRKDKLVKHLRKHHQVSALPSGTPLLMLTLVGGIPFASARALWKTTFAYRAPYLRGSVILGIRQPTLVWLLQPGMVRS